MGRHDTGRRGGRRVVHEGDSCEDLLKRLRDPELPQEDVEAALGPGQWLGDQIGGIGRGVHRGMGLPGAAADFVADVRSYFWERKFWRMVEQVQKEPGIGEKYLKTCVANACRDVAEARQSPPEVPCDFQENDHVACVPDPLNEWVEMDHLRSRMAHLPEDEREVIHRWLQGYNLREIAVTLAISYWKTRDRLSRALGHLRRWLE